jgi:hypothetical protein
MPKHMTMASANGALQILASGEIVDACQSCGVTEQDWKLLIGNRVWVNTDRPRIRRCLDSLIYGVIDMLGLPRFEIPAEFACSCIAMFVAPCNYTPACSWIGQHHRAEDLADYHGTMDGVAGMETVSASKMFALIGDIVGSGVHVPFQQALKKKTGIALPEVKNNEENQKSTKQVASKKV